MNAEQRAVLRRKAEALSNPDLRGTEYIKAACAYDDIVHDPQAVIGLLDRIEELETALRDVEWTDLVGICMWCGKYREAGHADDCQRQRAPGEEKA